MFHLKKKSNPALHLETKLESFLHLLRTHPLSTENFLDSLGQFVKIFNTETASIYLYEKKTNMFVLKKWVGAKPTRFSVSGEYEFLQYLKLKGVSVHRDEFLNRTASELREPALFYFQQILGDVATPLIENEEWYGIINVERNKDAVQDGGFIYDTILEIYADSLKKWLKYQNVVQENKKHSEMSHVKNQLLANVTHELQTPLNGILGLSEALLDDAEMPESFRPVLMSIKKSGDALHKTVNDILELVQIEAKKNQKAREKLDLIVMIEEVCFLFGETCKKKGVQLVCPMGREILVYVQPDQIRTVLMNLIGNAVKFTARGSIHVDVKKSGEMVHVCVSDTGIGIEEEKLHLIFEEFYQADGSHTRVYGGTGLGLAIAKKIISLHGGRIWVESEKDRGSKFFFTLPIYPV